MAFRVFNWELQILNLIRSTPRSGALYNFMFFWSHPPHWVLGVTLVLALAILVRYGQNFRPRLWRVYVLCIIAVSLGDVFSRRVIKVLIMRPRPNFFGEVCLQISCSGFLSSHATNMVAFSTVLCFFNKKNLFWCVPLCLLVCLSRIYIEEHYPLDVLAGICLGFFLGSFVWFAGGHLFDHSPLRSHAKTAWEKFMSVL
jgi:membrane-associated phospholipid phosphatase